MERSRSHSRLVRRIAFAGLLVALVLVLAVANIAGLNSAADAPPAQKSASRAEARTVTYTYDAAGRLVRADYGEGRAIVYVYDNAGNLLRRQVQAEMRVYLPIVLKGG